ncbi:AsmA family protein [Candidatus Kirkpatrickella diaphorinae]|uniref:AsmA family protein n=1 Tax=Candidatus Kirkpatrickella diaphorinae TaxID=2984322 RepID=A0ABY6GKE7_9PROT|nr:AsmA family protein [Candidatus Kirkpatrickella diaphorinae]UYH51295.1 AsmA family protein [Candidatus Kirkpatrickella diaphorinae]
MSLFKKSDTSGTNRWQSWPMLTLYIFAAIIVFLILFARGDWFIPLVEKQASAALGRKVSIEHLHLRPWRTTSLEVEGLRIAQPKAFEDRKADFASIKDIVVSFDVWRYLTGHGKELPLIKIDTPRADLASKADGTANYQFSDPSSESAPKDSKPFDPSSLPKIGDLIVSDGKINVALAKPKTDMEVAIATSKPRQDGDRDILINAQGRYDNAPITAQIKAGSLKDLTHESHPYPIEARVDNGPTRVDLKGVVKDPLHFKGTDLLLHFSGPDMALLYGLTGIPIPHTPPFDVKGQLAYSAEMIRFSNFAGRMGNSDIGGTIAVSPRDKPPYVDARLHSKNVDLADLGGFIGTKPGKAEDKAQAQRGKFLPADPINIPKLNAVNAHLVYHGDHIQNKNTPFDNINADVVIDHGAIDIKRLSYAIGSGELFLKGTLKPAGAKQFAANIAVDAKSLPLGKLLQGLGGKDSEGRMGGHAKLSARGNSIASLLGNGDGGVSLVIDRGGEITALLPNLLGLKLGSALLSALGLPEKTYLKCFVADLPLNNGVLSTRAFLLQTDDTRTLGGGTINLRTEKLDYHVTTRSTSFSILSLPGKVNISGSLRAPSVLPGAEIIGRAAATAALAAAFPPALVLPTIQFGVGKGSLCEQALNDVSIHPASGAAPALGKRHVKPNVTTPPHARSDSAEKVHQVWMKRLATQHKASR